MAEGIDYSGPVKTIHNSFCQATLERLTRDWPGGSYLVMKITPRVPGEKTHLTIGYKYNLRKVQSFIATEGDESPEPGDSYLYCFSDIYLMLLFALLLVLSC